MKIAKILMDVITLLLNDGNSLDYEPFIDFLKTEFDLVDKDEILQNLHEDCVEFLYRDDTVDPRKKMSKFRKLPPTWRIREIDITVLSLLVNAYETRPGVPSKELFEQIHHCVVNKRIWDNAVKHSRSAHKNTLFLHKTNGQKQVLDSDEILECLIDLDLITEIPQRFNQSGDPVYALEPGVTIEETEVKVTKTLRRELGGKVNQMLVHQYWPREQVVKPEPEFHHCKYCNERGKMFQILKGDFGIIMDPKLKSHNKQFALKDIPRCRIPRKNQQDRPIRVGEMKILRYILRCLAVVDKHFSRNIRQRAWWTELQDNLSLTTVLIQVDFKKTLYYRNFQKEKPNTKSTGTCPFCLTVIFRDPQTRQIVKLTRVLIPDVKHPNAFITLECLKQLLEDEGDDTLQDVLERAKNIFTMSDCAPYLVSKEVALFMLWDIVEYLPDLRSSSLTQRECRHGTVDPDRTFGQIQRAFDRAVAKGEKCSKAQHLKKIIDRMVRKSAYNKGKLDVCLNKFTGS